MPSRAGKRVAERVLPLPSALADEAVGAAEVTRQRDDEADRDVGHVGGGTLAVVATAMPRRRPEAPWLPRHLGSPDPRPRQQAGAS